MTISGWVQIALFSVIVILITRPLGGYMTRVFTGERTLLSPVLRPVERAVYWCCGVNENEEQHWLTYAIAMLFFSVAGFASLYVLQRLQWYLPFNPQGQTGVEPGLAFNTSVSFITNTNWQAYSGETTMGYLVQMAGLTVHNFVSAATGIAMALALIRGFVRREAKTIGNFWVDLTRGTLYLLLPISILGALLLLWQGVPQNLGAYVDATTLEGAKQTIAQGPVASQEIIKELGTNGGGFFNANSAHPFENPTALTNLIELLAIFAIGAALTNVLGRMVNDERQGWAIFAAMALLFVAGVATAYWSESHGNPAVAQYNVDSTATDVQAGGNMEGKEVRFGPALSALWATVTTDTSCGAVNSMHDSYLPIGGAVPMVNMQLGEVIFGGVGSGLYGILAFAIVAMFVAGLMVGRTPEYLGKKLEAKEVKMTILALLSLPLSILGWTALATVTPAGLAGILNGGPHGFSEILYAFTEGTANNGSAFAGLSANTMFYNLTIAFAMLMGRFIFVIPLLAVAGSLAQKKLLATSAGTFPTNRPLFVGLL
ncbi:MAG: potassium-transporting ATPase subunit KdpA, partial [Alphaproteobacteria bacterium]|nr:potassium-transporting ATPase subunit KdpA [Alphaproteobacteria bacterium]